MKKGGVSNFYKGKIGYSKLRWLYIQLNERDLSNFLVHSGMFNIAEDREFIESCCEFFLALKLEIEVKSLPPEIEYFTNREIKGAEFDKKLRSLLRVEPSLRSIVTTLDYYGILGSETLRYAINSLYFYIGEDNRAHIPSRDTVMSEISLMMLNLTSTNNSEELVRTLTKEYQYKANMVRLILKNGDNVKSKIEEDRDKTIKSLKTNIKIIDENLVGAIGELGDDIDEIIDKKNSEMNQLLEHHQSTQLNAVNLLTTQRNKISEALSSMLSEIGKLDLNKTINLNELDNKLSLMRISIANVTTSRSELEDFSKKYNTVLNEVSNALDSFKNLDIKESNELIKLELFIKELEKVITNNCQKYDDLMAGAGKILRTDFVRLQNKIRSLERNLSDTANNMISLSRAVNDFGGQKKNENNS